MGTIRVMVMQLIAVTTGFTASCAPVNQTNSSQSANSSSNPPGDAGIRDTLPTSTMLTLPSWCSLLRSQDQICFKCERTDGNVLIPYEQCLTPGDSFQSAVDCEFSDNVTKTINCTGTASGKPFVMDVSIAKEKVSTVIPALMLAAELVVKQKFSGSDSAQKLVSELNAFISSRIKGIANGTDPAGTAADLLLFVNRHAKTPLNSEQANLFKNTTSQALQMLADDLTGKKDYRVTTTILRLLSITRTLPDSQFAQIKPYLTGIGLAELLSEDRSQTLRQSFSILNPSILGVNSTDELIAELIKAP